MKKHEAEQQLDEMGHKINDLHASAWNTALHPTHHGWARSIVSAATIPVLSFASIGHMVGSAVVKQVSPKIIETLTGEPDTGETK